MAGARTIHIWTESDKTVVNKLVWADGGRGQWPWPGVGMGSPLRFAASAVPAGHVCVKGDYKKNVSPKNRNIYCLCIRRI